MFPEHAEPIYYAANIRKSGRWAVVNAEIIRAATQLEPKDHWRLVVFSSLTREVFAEYLKLGTAYRKRKGWDISLIAWRARNLLELLVWSTYCCKSEANARRFYVDAGRDANDLVRAFERWGKATSQPLDWIGQLTQARRDLSTQATEIGVDDLDQTNERTHIAAKECGMEDYYRIENKALSKFAHPTAMRVVAPDDREKYKPLGESFFSRGCSAFSAAFGVLEEHWLQRHSHSVPK